MLTHMKKVGISLNSKKSALSPAQRTTFLVVVCDSTTMQAHLSLACVESILSVRYKARSGTLSITNVDAVRSHDSSGQHHSTKPTAHKTMPVLGQEQWIPSSEPYIQGRKYHAPWATCSTTLEGAMVPKQKPGSQGRVVVKSQWALGEPSSSLPHKLPRNESNISETLPPTPEGLSCVGPHRQHLGISHWITDAISLSYEARGVALPLGIWAHSTRSVFQSSR